MCTSLVLLRSTLTLLQRKFRHVFYCVGNHELWYHAEAADGVDSFEKLLACYELAAELGVHAHVICGYPYSGKYRSMHVAARVLEPAELELGAYLGWKRARRELGARDARVQVAAPAALQAGGRLSVAHLLRRASVVERR